jgi:hypothetical protein
MNELFWVINDDLSNIDQPFKFQSHLFKVFNLTNPALTYYDGYIMAGFNPTFVPGPPIP